MFAILDCETTGLSPESDRIIEVAVLISDGRQVLSRFHFLMDPEQRIPPSISELTGILPSHVAGQPRFAHFARQILECTEGMILVGHNVRFDYGFLGAEFRRLGYVFRRPQLCTVRMARDYFPGLPSYSLGNLCSSLGLRAERRHRAEGDAQATAELFHRIVAHSGTEDPLSFAKNAKVPASLPPLLSQEKIDALPNSAGVYYFYDAHDTLLYVGKSRKIRERVVSHFMADTRSLRERKMKEAVTRIECKETGSELVALLLESAEIKILKPLYNRAQRKEKFSVGLYLENDGPGTCSRLSLQSLKGREDQFPFRAFGSATQAHRFLDAFIERHELCTNYVSRFKAFRLKKGPCFPFQLDRCRGACVGKESPIDYNQRLHEALGQPLDRRPSYLVVEPGRKRGEKAVVCVRDGVYQGYGYVNRLAPSDIQRALAQIERKDEYPDIRRILAHYITALPARSRLYPLSEEDFLEAEGVRHVVSSF